MSSDRIGYVCIAYAPTSKSLHLNTDNPPPKGVEYYIYIPYCNAGSTEAQSSRHSHFDSTIPVAKVLAAVKTYGHGHTFGFGNFAFILLR